MTSLTDIIHDTINNVDDIRNNISDQEYINITNNLQRIYNLGIEIPRSNFTYPEPSWLIALARIKYLGNMIYMLIAFVHIAVIIMCGLMILILGPIFPFVEIFVLYVLRRIIIMQLIMINAASINDPNYYWMKRALENFYERL